MDIYWQALMWAGVVAAIAGLTGIAAWERVAAMLVVAITGTVMVALLP